MATASILLSSELDSKAIKIYAMLLSVSVVMFWLYLALRTAIESFTGTVL
jgi:hypothetical protein